VLWVAWYRNPPLLLFPRDTYIFQTLLNETFYLVESVYGSNEVRVILIKFK